MDQETRDHLNLIRDDLKSIVTEMKSMHKEMVTIQSQISNYKGQLTMLKIIGGALAGLAVVVEPFIIWWVSKK